MAKSVGFLVGPNSSECGYCKALGETSKSFGIWAYTLEVKQYQLLLDRGWFAVV